MEIYVIHVKISRKKLLKGHEAIDILIDILHAASLIALLSAKNFVF